jgi:hypothetical protein
MVTVSYDGKPGIQALALTTQDHPPRGCMPVTFGTTNTSGWGPYRDWPDWIYTAEW